MKTRFVYLLTGLVAATVAVGLLVSSPPALAQEGDAAPADAESPRLTLQQLRDGHYQLPLLGDEETPIRFRGGQGSIRYGAGATERVEAGLVGDLVAFGDLDGDGVADAAVVAFVNTGGSGTFIHVLAVRDREGTPVQAGRQFLGDRRTREEHRRLGRPHLRGDGRARSRRRAVLPLDRNPARVHAAWAPAGADSGPRDRVAAAGGDDRDGRRGSGKYDAPVRRWPDLPGA